jgi:hypothetical protein
MGYTYYPPIERRGKHPDWAAIRQYWRNRRARLEIELPDVVAKIGAMKRIKKGINDD